MGVNLALISHPSMSLVMLSSFNGVYLKHAVHETHSSVLYGFIKSIIKKTKTGKKEKERKKSSLAISS